MSTEPIAQETAAEKRKAALAKAREAKALKKQAEAAGKAAAQADLAKTKDGMVELVCIYPNHQLFVDPPAKETVIVAGPSGRDKTIERNVPGVIVRFTNSRASIQKRHLDFIKDEDHVGRFRGYGTEYVEYDKLRAALRSDQADERVWARGFIKRMNTHRGIIGLLPRDVDRESDKHLISSLEAKVAALKAKLGEKGGEE